MNTDTLVRVRENLAYNNMAVCFLKELSIPERLVTLETLMAKLVALQIEARKPINDIAQISSTRPYTLDYKGRKHVFVYATSPLSLTIPGLGSYVLPSAEWTNLPFQEGAKITCSETSDQRLLIRCTDEVIP